MHRSKHFFMRNILILIWSGLMMTATQAAEPLWTIVPASGSNPTQTVLRNGTAIVQYVVQNQSRKSKKLVMQSIPGITQTTPCQLTPKGQAGSSCTLILAITGNALPKGGIHGGPGLCQANPDGNPNSNQCYQPSSANSLNITSGLAAGATITVNPSTLNFVAGTNGLVTVTNSMGSSEPAENVAATIPGASNISVQSTTCSTVLAIGASCTITFTTSVVEGPTNIGIGGNNTNTANVTVTATPIPIATLSVNPTTLLFTENFTGDVTVTNDASSPVAAENVAASIPGGSGISVQSTTCGAILMIGGSCTITFTSATEEGPTTIPIAGDNTNAVSVDITVINQPHISITSPVQQNRVVTVSFALPLLLEITNDVGSTNNATAITVSDKAACPNLSVDDSNCVSVAPGTSCILQLSSNTPYAPCTITVSGSNTANSPTTQIAFSYLGGLVFVESAGSGKVVIDAAEGFDSSWTSTYTDITGATSLDNGLNNTNAIIADPACIGSPFDCAAQGCQDIDTAWYLPAKNELLAVLNTLCSNASIPCNFGEFSNSDYFSSTQVVTLRAGIVVFPVNSGNFSVPKVTVYPVRCIRAFP